MTASERLDLALIAVADAARALSDNAYEPREEGDGYLLGRDDMQELRAALEEWTAASRALLAAQ